MTIICFSLTALIMLSTKWRQPSVLKSDGNAEVQLAIRERLGWKKKVRLKGSLWENNSLLFQFLKIRKKNMCALGCGHLVIDMSQPEQYMASLPRPCFSVVQIWSLSYPSCTESRYESKMAKMRNSRHKNHSPQTNGDVTMSASTSY